jgi:hypothetical protein
MSKPKAVKKDVPLTQYQIYFAAYNKKHKHAPLAGEWERYKKAHGIVSQSKSKPKRSAAMAPMIVHPQHRQVELKRVISKGRKSTTTGKYVDELSPYLQWKLSYNAQHGHNPPAGAWEASEFYRQPKKKRTKRKNVSVNDTRRSQEKAFQERKESFAAYGDVMMERAEPGKKRGNTPVAYAIDERLLVADEEDDDDDEEEDSEYEGEEEEDDDDEDIEVDEVAVEEEIIPTSRRNNNSFQQRAHTPVALKSQKPSKRSQSLLNKLSFGWVG